jgi:hypothetical protein
MRRHHIMVAVLGKTGHLMTKMQRERKRKEIGCIIL